MIDLHCHLLPGVDDGPRTLEEAIALCRMSVENGIRRAITTPHFLAITRKSTWDNIHAILANLQAALVANAIDLDLTVAAEVRICGELVSLITAGKVPFIGQLDGKPVLLLEFPHTASLPFGSEKLVKWLVGQNIRPMIAHPERNRTFQREPDTLAYYLKAGCLAQVTAGSLIGQFGPEAAETGLQLLDENLINIIATDAHDTETRPPCMRAGYDFIASHAGEAMARRLTHDTPLAILGA